MNLNFPIGSLIKARNREWVVLPGSTEELLLAKPLGGTEDEVTGIYRRLEEVAPASFAPPNSDFIGDYRSARLLRDSTRLGFRSSAGPFRSFARIAVEPRPYQLVPLLMSLKLDLVRLLIADDVGIGKTIEALLIARELLDRGEIERIAVLCPPPLAEQWQAEMRDKFYINAELVLPSTAARLERICRMGESLFERYPFVVVSTDFIKSERRRDEFVRTCPEFVIVDEAHTVAHGDASNGSSRRGSRHQRHELITRIAANRNRHILFVTATPHSGNEAAFRSLLTMLNNDFEQFPDDLSGAENERYRRELAQYFVQRRRADITAYLDAQTPFPQRLYEERSYRLNSDYQQLFDQALDYARETVQIDGEIGFRQRVRWWSALALLRALASSPAAAAATLRSRAATIDAPTEADIEEIGQRMVLDMMGEETSEGSDAIPGSDTSALEPTDRESSRSRHRLEEMAKIADSLMGERDNKLQGVIKLLKDLLRDGYSPIVFCRFISTVDYLTNELRNAIRNVEIAGVTGTLPPAERELRIAQLAEFPKRILVCTDCLSEGVNLQENFDAVLHYDLSWNPTRHEQREGRVDRYGQPSKQVKVVTYYGGDNYIDGIVLKVLLMKHKTIRDSLGISIPIPTDTADVMEAIFKGLLLTEHEHQDYKAQALPGFEQFMLPKQLEFDWDRAAEREKRSRSMFAQHSIKVEEVAAEIAAAREAIGSQVDVVEFMQQAITMHGGIVSVNGNYKFELSKETPRAMREAVRQAIGAVDKQNEDIVKFAARFDLPVKQGELYLTRTHPAVEALATYVMESALDNTLDPGDESHQGPRARRCGAMRTSQVNTRTTVILLRMRYHLTTTLGGKQNQTLAEDSLIATFEGAPESARWLTGETAESLLHAQPDANITDAQAREFVRRVIDGYDYLAPQVDQFARQRADELLVAHQRVRTASRQRGLRYAVEPQLPPDVVGVYVYLPFRASST